MLSGRWLGLCVLLVVFSGTSALEIELDFGETGAEDALPSAVAKGLDEAYGLNARGIAALEKGELDLAGALFEEALTKFPQYTDAENNRAVVHFRRGNIGQARDIWKKLAKRESRYAIASYNLGVLAVHEHDEAVAIGYFEDALKTNRGFFEARVMLGRTQLGAGRPDEAVDQFRRAHKLRPDDADGWSHYAYALIVTGDTTEAVTILREHAQHAEALRMLGTIAAARGDMAAAVEQLGKAVEKGTDPEVMVTLASALHDAGRVREAREALDRYLSTRQAQASADAWLLAGVVAKELGDIGASRRYFESGSRYYPNDAILRHNLAKVCFLQKDLATAERLWSTLSDSLQDPAVYHLRALTALRQGDLAASEELIRKALKLDERASYCDLLGVILYRREQADSAAYWFKRALRLDPRQRSAQLNLALVKGAGEELSEALAEAERKLAACTHECADAAFQLSVLHYHNNDFGAAAAVLEAVPEKERDERIYRHLCIYYRQTHDYDKAIAALEQAKKRLVLDQKTEAELADLLLLAGRHARAVDVLTKLIEKWEGNRWRLFYQLGYAYMEMNELEKARHYFERSIKAKRDNVAARGLLAFVHNRLGNTGTARELWEHNLKDDPTNSTLLVNVGLSKEQAGDYHGALANYRKAAMLRPDDTAIQINIGNAYAGMEQLVDACHAYSLALDSPKRKEAAYNVFLVALRMKDEKKMRSMAGILEKEFRSSAYNRRVQAELGLWDGDSTRAVTMLEELEDKGDDDHALLARLYAVRAKTQKARAHLGRLPADSAWDRTRAEIEARIAFAEGKCEKALRLFEQLPDTSFAARYNEALTAFTCGDYRRALRGAQQLVRSAKGPDRADVCRLAGNAAFALREWASARTWYEQLSGIESHSPVVQYNLAVASYNLGDIDRAWGHYTCARKLDPTIRNPDIERRHRAQSQTTAAEGKGVLDTLDSLYNAAVSLQERDSVAAAEQLYRRIVEQDPEYALAWNNLGALHAARGRFEQAEQYYQRAVAKRHDIPEAYANLVALYLATGDFSQAKRWIIKGRGHNPESELLEQVEGMVRDSMTLEVETRE